MVPDVVTAPLLVYPCWATSTLVTEPPPPPPVPAKANCALVRASRLLELTVPLVRLAPFKAEPLVKTFPFTAVAVTMPRELVLKVKLSPANPAMFTKRLLVPKLKRAGDNVP